MVVFENAPANVLHGVVRPHGLASSPTPETHVLVACAGAWLAIESASAAPITIKTDASLCMKAPHETAAWRAWRVFAEHQKTTGIAADAGRG
jgi:hypothetical protein